MLLCLSYCGDAGGILGIVPLCLPAAHVYDENGDEILTYTGGVGWHEKPSKAETQVHQSLKFAYYDAYYAVRQNMKGMVSEPLDIEGEQVSQSCFDVKA